MLVFSLLVGGIPLLASPLLITRGKKVEAETVKPDPINDTTLEPLIEQPAQSSDHDQNHTPWEMVKSLEFWLLWFIFLIVVGVSMTVVTNLGSLVLALHGD